MQKIISLRESQKGLDEALKSYVKAGWKVVSTTRGGEWTRILNTYKRTVILEIEDKTVKKENPDKVGLSDQIEKANKLYKDGAITEEEYIALKKKLLDLY